MSPRTNTLAETGISGTLNWLAGGALGGIVGAILFGGLLWLVDPAILTDSIPGVYGFEGGLIGWALHLVHGLILGVIFGFFLTREVILGTITADVETPALAAMSPNVRITFAGLVYGLAVWVVISGIFLSVLATVGSLTDPLPWVSAYNLVGHLLFGMLLGALLSIFIDVETRARETEAPFPEATDPPSEHHE